MQDDKCTTPTGKFNLRPTKGTHWVMFMNAYYLDSLGCPQPRNITNHIKIVIHAEYRIQKEDSYCAACCLSITYLQLIVYHMHCSSVLFSVSSL